MKAYAVNHEAKIQKAISEKKVTRVLIVKHKEHIRWLQHERLIHLLVFLFTLASLITFFIVSLCVDNIWMIVLTVILLILSGFYCAHYYFLENTVQRWYKLCDELEALDTEVG